MHPEHKLPGVLFCGDDTTNFGSTEIVAEWGFTATLARGVNCRISAATPHRRHLEGGVPPRVALWATRGP